VYTVLLSILTGIAVGVIYTLLGFWKTWAMGIILGALAAVATLAIVSRILARRLEPRFLDAQKQIQAGANPLALKTLQDLLPMARWQIMLKGQIYAQMGLLAYAMEKEADALGYLRQAGHRVPDARLALAALLYRRKDYDEAYEVMQMTIKANKKQIVLYNVYAWLLNKQGQREKAVEQLQACLKVEKSNETTKDNLLRLQNNRKMNMKKFGMQWYGLKLEKPPASMRQMPPGMHKGFRQKSKRQRGR
jgi:tetratricopeptide (TPR) repeat protein